jgi:hypothetical protein
MRKIRASQIILVIPTRVPTTQGNLTTPGNPDHGPPENPGGGAMAVEETMAVVGMEAMVETMEMTKEAAMEVVITTPAKTMAVTPAMVEEAKVTATDRTEIMETVATITKAEVITVT